MNSHSAEVQARIAKIIDQVGGTERQVAFAWENVARSDYDTAELTVEALDCFAMSLESIVAEANPKFM